MKDLLDLDSLLHLCDLKDQERCLEEKGSRLFSSDRLQGDRLQG